MKRKLAFACCCLLVGRVGSHVAAAQVQAAQVPSPTDPAVRAKLNLPVPANPSLPTLFLVGDSTVQERTWRWSAGTVGLG